MATGDTVETAGRVAIVLLGAAVAAAFGYALFVRFPGGNIGVLLGVLLALASAILGARFASRFAGSVFPRYNVAEVAVEGRITRDGDGGRLPRAPTSPGADDIVDRIERANEDDAVSALLVKLNTPGGAVVPSEDIRLAAERFDGPTIAYATDTCASGGYWIAAGCDELWAREGSLIGSIGVIGSRVTAADLIDRAGLSYERLAAGDYKDAGVPLKELEADEREYLQGLVDDYYEAFVDTVVEGRDLDADEVRGTEARVFLGGAAAERGLVDDIGSREDVEAHLESTLDEPVSVREFTPDIGLAARLRGSAERVAYAAGAGAAGVLAGGEVDDVPRLRL